MIETLKSLARRASPLLGLLIALTALSVVLPVGQALWAKTLRVSGTVHTKVFEGCSTGFWKQEQHFELWPADYSTDDRFEEVFGVDVPGNPTLLQALQLKGGGLEALMRQSTAALLNAASAEVDFPFTPDQVIQMFQEAFDSGDYEPLTKVFEAANEAGCPLSTPPEAGTTLGAEKTAVGFWEVHLAYDWELSQTADPVSLAMDPGTLGSVAFSLKATRTLSSETETTGVRGEVCVTNGGEVATENLAIEDVVQVKTKGPFTDYETQSVDVSPRPVLEPGENHCYPYEVTFEPVEGAKYRNLARVTITNHSGYLGEPFGPEVKADFSLPGGPATLTRDAQADLNDSLACPEGFTCTQSDPGPWTFASTDEIAVTVEANHEDALCGGYELVNNADLVESETGETHESSAVIDLDLSGCEPETASVVQPILECVTGEADGSFTAVFGYLNENGAEVTIPIGPENGFTPAPEDRGQPTAFGPGRTPPEEGAFRVPFDGEALTWTLQGSSVSASSASERCPAPEPTSTPTPTPEPEQSS